MCSVFDVARYFLDKQTPLSLLQINKLCYIAYGYVAGLCEEQLFNEEIFAYQYGPVVTELYQYCKEKHEDLTTKPNYSDLFIVRPGRVEKGDSRNIEPSYIKILDFVHQRYANFSGSALSELTHKKGTPWDQAYNSPSVDKDKKEKNLIPIEHSSIEKHFKTLIL